MVVNAAGHSSSLRAVVFLGALLLACGLGGCSRRCPTGFSEQSGICRSTAATEAAADSGVFDGSVSDGQAAAAVADAGRATIAQRPQQPGMSQCSSGMACSSGCGECCFDADCPSKRGWTGRCGASLTCEYACEAGSMECAGECVQDAQCCSDQDCGERDGRAGMCDRSTRRCEWSCASGTEPCAGVCIANGSCCDANSCTDGFECVAGSCSSSQCQRGRKLCGSRCIMEDECCEDRDCAGNFACTNGLCSRTRCSVAHKLCRGQCIAQDACCLDEECGDARSCVEHRCADTGCPVGSVSCGGACLPATACCADADCSGKHACVNHMCSASVCVSGSKACEDGRCIAVDSCCDDAECRDGRSCVSGRCSDACQPGYVSCSSGTCMQVQGACVAIVFTVDPATDCTTNVCVPEAEVCKTNPFRRIFMPSNDLTTLTALCQPSFPAMRDSICAAPELAGRADVMVRFIVDQYDDQGVWQANANVAYTSCAP